MVVDSQQSTIQELSWKSIEAFGHAQSGLEHLVETVKLRRDRKSKMYSWVASAAVLATVCYVLAAMVQGYQDEEAAPEDYHGSPKFLMAMP